MNNKSFSLKKILTMAIFALAMGQAWGALADTTIAGKTYKKIGTCADLKEFSTNINNGSFAINTNAIVTQNIDCSGVTTTDQPLTPIGGNSSPKQYAGTFNGAGFVINNLVVNLGSGSPQYGGLFGYIGAAGVVEDVVLYDLTVKAATTSGGDDYVGGIAGRSAGKIIGCTVAGTATIEGRRSVGGIVGYADSGAEIKNCLCTAKVNATGSSDYDQDRKSATYVGGIVGRAAANVTVASCVYNGNSITRVDKTEVNTANVFPIAGGAATVENCYYNGNAISEEAGLCGNDADGEGGSCSIGYDAASCTGVWQKSSANHTASYCTIGGVNVSFSETNCVSKGGTWIASGCGAGVPDLTADTVLCNLNGGTMVNGECYGGDEPWTDEEDITNHGGVHSDGDSTVYDIKFDPNGGTFAEGTTPKVVKVKANAAIDTTGLGFPTRAGDVFKGWALIANASSASALGTATGAVTFYAVWQNSVIVTFDANGGTFPKNAVTTKRVTKNSETITAEGIDSPSLTGTAFIGWALTSDATEAASSLGTTDRAITVYAVYTGSFTVSFNSNGHGTFAPGAVRTKTVDIGDPITADGIATPTAATGYSFVGWSLDKDATTAGSLGTMGTADVTVYAVWAESKVKITFNPNGGYFDNTKTATAAREKYVRSGNIINSDSVSNSTPPVKKDETSYCDKPGYTKKKKCTDNGGHWITETYSFLGWNTNKDATTAFADLGTASTEKIYYAIFSTENIYTITFHDNGHGTLPEDQRVVRQTGGSIVAEPTALTATGFSFGGWYTDEACTEANKFNFSTKITQDTDLYAKWTAHTNNLKFVVLDENKDTVETFEKTVSVDSLISTAPKTAEGYTYTEWSTTSDNVVIENSQFYMPDNDVVLTCTQTPESYELVWKLMGGTIDESVDYTAAGFVDYNAQVTAPVVTKLGYAFVKWTSNGTDEISFPTAMPGKKTTYYAVWEEAEIPTYTITYKAFGATHGNEGKVLATVSYKEGATITERELPAAITGYDRSGWVWKNASTEVEVSAPTTMPGYNLLAEVTYTVQKFQVTFDGNGKTISTPSQNIERNALVSEPEAPAAEGVHFAGWYKEAACTNAWNFATDKITAATTLYAKWTYTITYKVVYNCPTTNPKTGEPMWKEGCGPTDPIEGNPTEDWTEDGVYGTSVFVSETKLEGAQTSYKGKSTSYTQIGWSTDPKGTVEYNFNAEYTGNADLTLYPVFAVEGVLYDVTFEPGTAEGVKASDGESAAESVTMSKAEGSSVNLLGVTYTRTGYVQTGWTTTDGGTKTHELSEEYSADEVITLYPVWTAVRTVTYSIDGTVVDSLTQQVLEGDEVTVPTIADKNENNTFAGWTVITEDVTIAEGKFTMPAKDVEISGAFNYMVTYKMDGNQYGDVEIYPYGTKVTVKAKVDSTGYTVTDWTSAQVTDEDMAAGEFTLTGDVVINATSTINKYGITFVNANGDTVLATVEYDYGTAAADIAKPATNPTMAATAQYTFTFKGWTPDFVDVTDTATYTAVYDTTVNKYAVTFVNADGDTVLASAEYDYGTAAADIVKPATDPTMAATAQYTFTFKGWTPDFVDVTDTATYTAVYDTTVNKYAVTFVNANGDTVLASAEYDYGTAAADIVKPATDPTMAATQQYTFTFKGWTPDFVDVTDTATYTAVYDTTVNKYAVTFVNANGDTVLASAEYDYGTAAADIAKPATNPTMAATAQYTFTFKGWTPDFVDVTDTATYTAVYDTTVNKYAVTFVNANGDTVLASAEYDYGTAAADIVKPATDPTMAATAQYTFTFKGWTPEIVDVTDTTTYTAVYDTTVNKYAVTFVNANGDTVLASAEYDYGTAAADIAKPATDPTMAATAQYTFTFKGWTPDFVDVTDTATYTAVYDTTVNKYEITWKNYDNSVLAVDSVAYDETPSYGGETPEKPATAEKTYTFIGWDPDVVAVTGDAVYTAQFTDVAVPYELAWDFAGGEATGEYTAAGEVLTGATLKYPTSVTKTGYDFAGWDPASVTVMPAEDLTLTAQWTPVEYTITYVTNDGSAISSSSYTIESDDVVLSTATTKTGYTFAGWYANETLTGDTVMSVKAGSTGNKTFYAKWTINPYTITFDTKGGSEVAPITQNYGTAVTAPAAPTKEHYSFGGWDKAVPTSMPAENMTITAQWTPDEFSIAYVMNGGEQPADTYKKYTYSETDAFALPGSATYSGWNFAGWYKEAAFANSMTELAAKTFGDTTVYAKFTKEVIADLGDVDGDGTNDTIHVVIDNNDTEDSVSVKTTEEAENSVPPMVPADSTKDPYDYTFKEYQCDSAEVGAAVDYTCKAVFDSTAKTYNIAYEMAGGDQPADEYKTYTYSETDAFALPSSATYSGWNFAGWYKESAFTNSMTELAVKTFGDTTVYAKFTKEVKADIGDVDGDGKNDTITVVIDNNDTEDSVSVKTTEEAKDNDPPMVPGDSTKDPYDYTFKEYQCDSAEVGAAVDYTCKAVFDSTAKTYDIAYVMNGGEQPADEYKTYTYSETDAFALPNSATYSDWDFAGWYKETAFANSMTELAAKTFGDTTVYAKFTKVVVAVLSEDPEITVEVTIDNNDDGDDIDEKVTQTASDSSITEPTKPQDDGYTYEFDHYTCEESEIVAYQLDCEPVFTPTARTYNIAYEMAGGDQPADTYKKYTYSETDAFALPSSATYSGWNFAGWYKEAAFANSMTELAAKTFGDTTVYAKFTKEVKADIGDVDGDGKNDTITVVIDNNDTEDSVSVKTTEEAKDNDPPMVPADSTKDPYDYTFKEYQCDSAEVGAAVDYTCKAVFDSTAKTYNIAYVMNGGEQPADTYKKYTYSETDAFALPGSATYSGWNFAGWYKEAAFANSMTELAAKTFGDTTVYAKFTKEVIADLGDVDGDGTNDTIHVVIDNNDTEDSVSVKTTEEAEDKVPPVVPANDSTGSDGYDYTFKEYQCDSAEVGADVDYTCKAIFDTTAHTYEIVLDIPDSVQVDCDGITACVITATDTTVIHKYGEETILPEAFVVDSTGNKDTTWEFQGWVDSDGDTVTVIPDTAMADTLKPSFTKELDIIIVAEPDSDTIHVVIDNDDTQDSIETKVQEEAEKHVPPLPRDTVIVDTPYVYTYNDSIGFECEFVSATEMKCEAAYDTTGMEFEIVLDIPDSVQVDCDGITACVITATDTTVIHKYGEETILPEAFVVDSTGNKDTTWEFQGWVDSDGDTVTVIPDTAMADTLKPSFIKELDIIIVAEPDSDTIHVVIDNDDTQDSIETKVQEEAEKHVPPLPRDTVIVDTPYVYTYNDSIGFECEFVSATEMKCEAAYDTTAMEFEIVLDIPDSVQVDCDGITACVITATDTTVIHKYGEETILPEAFVVDSTGNKDTTWEFQGWVDSDGDTVTVIPDTAMADTLKPSFIKELDIIIVAEPDSDTIHVVIDNDDTQDSIETKVQEEAEKHVPPLPRDTVIVDTPYVYTYNDSIGFECEFVSATEMKCEAAYDTTAMDFEIVLDIPDSVQVDCDGITACVITATDTTVIHKYGEETKLPEAFVVDSTGNKDTTWDFNGWVNTNGDTLMVIPADAYGDTLKPDFTKEIKVVIGDDTLIVVIDPDDTQDSIDTKVTEEAENHVPPIVPNPSTYTDTPYVYEYKGYECEPTDKIDVYECKAVYDSTGMDFEVVLVVPDTAIVDCDGVEACRITTDSTTGLPIDTTVVHKYGEETILPEAHVIDADGKIDSTWEFAGWFDNDDGQGDTVKVIPAEAYGDTLYPFFTKEIEVIIGDDTITVVIDQNDTQDSINTKVKEEAENHVPPIVPNPSTYIEPPYEYTYNGYDCEPAGKDVYVCETTYDSVKVGAQYKIVYMMPKAAVLSKNIKSYTEGVGTILPTASLKGTDGWQFMGWYTDERFVGTRVQEIKASEKGKKVFYPMFQKTLTYSTRDGSGEISVIYNEAELDMVERTLAGVIPTDYTEGGITYTFDKWFEKDNHFTAQYIDASKTGLANRAIAKFQVMVSGRTLEISGAKMGAKIAVYGMNGRLVTQGIVENGTTRVELTKAGSYVVRVNNQYSRVDVH